MLGLRHNFASSESASTVLISSLVASCLKEVYMGKKLYVGNLPFSATDQTLNETFSKCGNVESAKIITDRDSGRSKGFGFVEMSSEEEAQNAIKTYNGANCDGRPMTVNEAKPMAPRESRGGGGGFGGGDRGPRGGFGGGGRGNKRW